MMNTKKIELYIFLYSLVLRSALKLLCPMKVKLYYVPPFHQNSFTIIYVSCNYQKRSAARGYIFLDFYTRYANRKLGCAFKTFAFNSLHVDDFERLSMNQNLFSNIICQVKNRPVFQFQHQPKYLHFPFLIFH